jgi:hypothetical protein
MSAHWTGFQNAYQSLMTVSLVLMAHAASAELSARRFHYRSLDAVAANLSEADDLSCNVTTRIEVRPYLYVSGEVNNTWTIDGWGNGGQEQSDSFRLFHSQSITLNFDRFGDPRKISGTTRGNQRVTVDGQFRFTNGISGTILFDTGRLDGPQLRDLNRVVPSFRPEDTGGVLHVQIDERITVPVDAGPGTYENVGTITVVRN